MNSHPAGGSQRAHPSESTLRAPLLHARIHAARAGDGKVYDYSSRDYFKILSKAPAIGLVFTGKLTGVVTKRSIIAIAVPWLDSQGRFAGVITSTIALKGLEGLLTTATSNTDDAILIRDWRNEELLARYDPHPFVPAPGAKPIARPTGLVGSSSQAIRSGKAFGRYVIPRSEASDDMRHFVTFKRLPGTPFFLIVRLGESHLAPWRSLIALLCAFGAGFALLSAYAAWSLSRHEREARLAERERQALNASLEGQVDARTADLQNALDRVTHDQEELAGAEKLASLGKMVAGVSHELSTPLGNALLTATAMSEDAQALESAVANASARPLKRSVGKLRRQAEIQTASIEHATTLVRAFKQVALDQTSERKRAFDLGEALENVVTSFLPTIAKADAKVETRLDAPRGVACDTFPGALVQIASNMIQNALRHAFDGRARGTISIRSWSELVEQGPDAGTWAVVDFRDDGAGLPPGSEAKIFDPYFTTKASSGGSGLGLSLSRQLARTALGGELSGANSPGGGAVFTLRFPAQRS